MAHSPKVPAERSGAADQGSVSVYLVLSVSLLVCFVGIAADFSGALHAKQQAQDVARQAARAGAQAASAESALQGEAPRVETAEAVRAADVHLAALGATGQARAGADWVEVTTIATYQPLFLSLAGIDSIQVTGHSTATIERGVLGVRR